MPRSRTARPAKNVRAVAQTLRRLRDHRATAVMGAAFVENYLGLALLSRLRALSKEEADSIFDGNGHGLLSSLSAKIWAGYCLNLYGRGVRSDLLKIKNIRNIMAHEMEPITFRSDRILEMCNKLEAPKHLADANEKRESTDPKVRFLDTIYHLAAGFYLAARHHVHRPAEPDTLHY